jgi:hypothetical protein
MYRMNEIELWSQRRQELGCEAEVGRLAQSLRAARPKRASRFRRALLGWSLQAPVRPRAASSGRA